MLTAELQAVFQQHSCFYSSPHVHQKLVAASRQVGSHRMARLRPQASAQRLKRAQLQGKTRKAFCTCSMASSGAYGAQGNPLLHELQAQGS